MLLDADSSDIQRIDQCLVLPAAQFKRNDSALVAAPHLHNWIVAAVTYAHNVAGEKEND